MKSNSVQEACEDQLSDISSQEASNSSSSRWPPSNYRSPSPPPPPLSRAPPKATAAAGVRRPRRSRGSRRACSRAKFISSQVLGGTRTRTGGSARWPGAPCTASMLYPYGYADVASLPLYAPTGAGGRCWARCRSSLAPMRRLDSCGREASGHHHRLAACSPPARSSTTEAPTSAAVSAAGWCKPRRSRT